MKPFVFGTLSALVLASTFVPAIIPAAQAQISARMNPTAPFISDSGLVGARADRHFISVAVIGFPLEELTISLPNNMRTLKGATITDKTGKEIAADVEITSGMVTIKFPQAIAPENDLTVTLSGVEMDKNGGTALYRVSAVNQGLVGTIPIGTAMVRLPDISG